MEAFQEIPVCFCLAVLVIGTSELPLVLATRACKHDGAPVSLQRTLSADLLVRQPIPVTHCNPSKLSFQSLRTISQLAPLSIYRQNSMHLFSHVMSNSPSLSSRSVFPQELVFLHFNTIVFGAILLCLTLCLLTLSVISSLTGLLTALSFTHHS